MEWKISNKPVDYAQAVRFMEERVAAIAAGEAAETVWLLEHPPLYTAGSSARPSDLLNPRFPVYPTGRGGQYTYHGPGQRIAYVMLDLKRRDGGVPDLRRYVHTLEQWMIDSLAHFGIEGFIREGRVGVWVNPAAEKKIAALGIRVRSGVSYHGIALNVNPVLSHYNGIVPCGIRDYGVTSLWEMGIKASMTEVDAVLRTEFNKLF